MTDNQIKHLEMIQGIISRMNTNSFQIKGGCITLISILATVFSVNQESILFLFCGAVSLTAWFLDAFYLKTERDFKNLYKDIIDGKNIPEFSMKRMSDENYWHVLFTRKTLWMYPALLIITIGLYMFI